MKNNIKYFHNPQTLEDLKKQYHELAFKHHPDRGGSNEDMKTVNIEYFGVDILKIVMVCIIITTLILTGCIIGRYLKRRKYFVPKETLAYA